MKDEIALSSSAHQPAAEPASKPDPIGSQTRWSILITAMVLLILPIVAFSQIAAHTRVDIVDDQMFGYFGWRVAHGAILYEDVWDNKPPGIYWINALGFVLGGDSYGGVVFLCAVAVAVALTCFFIISASIFFRGAAAAATVLAAFYFTHGFSHGGANRTETFLMAFELAAVMFYFRGFARDRWWKWFLAGMCCGCALLLKQVGLAAWGALGLHMIILVVMRDVDWRAGLRRCLLLLGGLLVIVGLATVVIVAQGAAKQAYFAIIGFNQAYFTSGRSSLTDFELNDYMLRQHIGLVLLLPVLMTITALIHSVLWRIRPLFRPKDIEDQLDALRPVCPRYMVLFFIWYCVAYYGAAISPHHFEHYLLPTLPPMMLMAGYVISILRGELSLTKRFQQRIWVTGCFVAMGYFALDGLRWHYQELSRVWLFRLQPPFKQAIWETVGDAVKKLTGPEDRIQCLGYLPGVYLRARRLNASRYTTTEKIGQVKHAAEAEIIRHEIAEQLEETRPALMVVSDHDYGLIFSPDPESEYSGWYREWIEDFLVSNYEMVLEVVDFNVYIYQRKDLASRSTPSTGDMP